MKCLLTAALVAALTAVGVAAGDNWKPLRPNVILCMSDDQGWGDTGYNGHPVLRTPNLDRMAEEGIRFDRFYSADPVCSPTRGSCLTGRHPERYGITYANAGHLKKQEVTLPEVLKDLGYATGHFGKWHLGTLTTNILDSNRGAPGATDHYAPPWDHGFDVCFSTEAKVPTYWHEGMYEEYGTHYWTGPGDKVDESEVMGDDSRLIMDRALPFIQNAAGSSTPFLAVIWFHAPHLPVRSEPPYTDGYREHADYYGCMTALDEQMGRLRAELERLQVAENTMIWFCSDNGPEGDETAPGRTHGLRGRKRSLYEGGVRVPGLLVWPEMVREGQRISMPCSTSDYFPTILDVVDHRLPEDLSRPYDGISLLPLIRGQMNRRPEPIAFESRDQLSLVGNRFKIYSSDGGKTFELYDLIEDPAEQTNLAEDRPQQVQSMAAILREWRQSCAESRAGSDY